VKLGKANKETVLASRIIDRTHVAQNPEQVSRVGAIHEAASNGSDASNGREPPVCVRQDSDARSSGFPTVCDRNHAEDPSACVSVKTARQDIAPTYVFSRRTDRLSYLYSATPPLP
jgi:hypothetical protein